MQQHQKKKKQKEEKEHKMKIILGAESQHKQYKRYAFLTQGMSEKTPGECPEQQR